MTITERIDAITGLTPEYSKQILPAPKSVKIELTGRCNFACSFCARSQVLRDQKDMDKAFFRRIVKDMRDAGVEELGMFYLGESFLCKWLPEAIEYAKHEVGFPYVFLTTNGSISTPQRVDDCIRAGLDSLKFSFNYCDEEQFKDIAKVKPALYRKMLENVKAAHPVRELVAKQTGHRCGLYASYIQYDGAQGEKMAKAVEEIKPFVDEVYGLPLYNQANLISDDGTWDFTAGNRGRLDNLRDPLPCWAVFTEGHITWDGHLSACCFDHDGRFHMGDLKELDFMEAWNSKRFQELRGAHLKKNVEGTVCEGCVAYA
jgi:MoaA/NifB/PqqE/SkfB family radical SAM enzyme